MFSSIILVSQLPLNAPPKQKLSQAIMQTSWTPCLDDAAQQHAHLYFVHLAHHCTSAKFTTFHALVITSPNAIEMPFTLSTCSWEENYAQKEESTSCTLIHCVSLLGLCTIPVRLVQFTNTIDVYSAQVVSLLMPATC